MCAACSARRRGRDCPLLPHRVPVSILLYAKDCALAARRWSPPPARARAMMLPSHRSHGRGSAHRGWSGRAGPAAARPGRDPGRSSLRAHIRSWAWATCHKRVYPVPDTVTEGVSPPVCDAPGRHIRLASLGVAICCARRRGGHSNGPDLPRTEGTRLTACLPLASYPCETQASLAFIPRPALRRGLSCPQACAAPALSLSD